jgi:hypothetical protein
MSEEKNGISPVHVVAIGTKRTSDGGVWKFSYKLGSSFDDFFGNQTITQEPYDTTVVNTPSGTSIEYRFNATSVNNYVLPAWSIGLITEKITRSGLDAGPLRFSPTIQSEKYSWIPQKIGNESTLTYLTAWSQARRNIRSDSDTIHSQPWRGNLPNYLLKPRRIRQPTNHRRIRPQWGHTNHELDLLHRPHQMDRQTGRR